ncbi:MAG: hypothetical protein SGARI_003023 [Bacillariaceae sp.]
MAAPAGNPTIVANNATITILCDAHFRGNRNGKVDDFLAKAAENAIAVAAADWDADNTIYDCLQSAWETDIINAHEGALAVAWSPHVGRWIVRFSIEYRFSEVVRLLVHTDVQVAHLVSYAAFHLKGLAQAATPAQKSATLQAGLLAGVAACLPVDQNDGALFTMAKKTLLCTSVRDRIGLLMAPEPPVTPRLMFQRPIEGLNYGIYYQLVEDACDAYLLTPNGTVFQFRRFFQNRLENMVPLFPQ